MLKNTIRLWSLKSLNNKSFRFMSTAVEDAVKDPPKKRKRDKKEDPVAQRDVIKYFSDSTRSKALEYPSTILTKSKKKSIDGFYLADSLGADVMFEEITKDLPTDRPIYEINSGLGFLSERLIAETKNRLVFCEPDKYCFFKLNELAAKNNDREIEVKNVNFVALWKLEFLDKFDDGNRINSLFMDVKRAQYFEDPVMRVVGCVGAHTFFRDLINSVIFQNSFMLPGRPEFYICVPPSVYLQMTCSSSAGYMFYRQTSVLFQILFEYELIKKVNRKYFLPWRTQASTLRKEKIMKLDNDDMYLVRVTPRKNLFQYCLPSHLTALWFFIKQHLRSRSKAVIPTMERWIPGCGLRLIVNAKPPTKPTPLFPNENINSLPDYYTPCQSLTVNDYVDNIHVFTQFGSLTPMQILTIFDQFIHWSEYESSAFGELLEKHLEKIYSNPDENSHEIESDDEEETVEVNEENR